MELKSLAEIVRNWATGQPRIRRAYLFGSRARGTGRPDSDLDVAVEIEPEPGGRSVTLIWMDEGDDLERSLAAALSPIRVQLELYDGPTGSPTIHKGLSEGGKLVYDKHAR